MEVEDERTARPVVGTVAESKTGDSTTDRMSRGQSAQLVWKAHSSPCSSRDIDRFVAALHERFPKPFEVCEESALQLLQAFEHNVPSAIQFTEATHPEVPPSPDGRHRDVGRGRSRISSAGHNEEFCLVCKRGGTVIICDEDSCSQLYHPSCIGLANVPQGRWNCPRHQCVFCDSHRSPILQCSTCWISYCARHAPFGNDIGDLGMAFRCIRCDPNHAESRRWFSDELKATLPPDSQTVKRDGKVLGKPVDLWVLYHSVIVMGGFENVPADSWRRVANHLGFHLPARESDVCHILSNAYESLLLPFERRVFSRPGLGTEDTSQSLSEGPS
ncbi:unnamed protein product (mitochondrion) [Plasmodiophora brassicae]|uniref:PHD-type domain-containing protein n=1 Tax=Plasmodiophora brassicae TaxID=37360 RepID=A0A3P3YC19_PLABS|nr:unnamed protein product [Plasmodiophora brassicae]